MTKRVDIETLEQWKPKGAGVLRHTTPGQTAISEQLYQCFVYVLGNPAASQRLLRLRDVKTPWEVCLEVLRAEFPAAPKVAVVPPTV